VWRRAAWAALISIVAFGFGTSPGRTLNVVDDANSGFMGLPSRVLVIGPDDNANITPRCCLCFPVPWYARGKRDIGKHLDIVESAFVTSATLSGNNECRTIAGAPSNEDIGFLARGFAGIGDCNAIGDGRAALSRSDWQDRAYPHPRALVCLHSRQLALHDSKLLIGSFGLPTRINRQGECQECNCSGSGCGNKAVMTVQAIHEPSERTIYKTLSIFFNLVIIAFGYLFLTWGGGAFLLWRNPVGLLCSGTAIVFGVACLIHGFWYLVH
jgi:hypothetical protein